MSNIDQLAFSDFASLSGVSDAELVAYLNNMYKQGSYPTVSSLQYKIGGNIAWVWREKPTSHLLYKNYFVGHPNQDSGVKAAKADVARLWEAIKNPAALQKRAASAPNINSAPLSTTSSNTSVPVVPTSTAVSTTAVSTVAASTASEEEGFKKYFTTKNMLIGGAATAAILFFVLK
ncbi:hypothetical protein PZB74_20825 [Porifericola rhodea]|uniref:hypothetical protein n=1 Tax=Porifericola rhodea TaxID=930972 RepID=UPI002666F70A|nr:hypothetical protein [Porifericola rhodea]WKN31397.1 hypothetical protein PZB74_20825 [Porifericola rhodea]